MAQGRQKALRVKIKELFLQVLFSSTSRNQVDLKGQQISLKFMKLYNLHWNLYQSWDVAKTHYLNSSK